MIIVVFVGSVYFIQFLIGSIVLLGYFKKKPETKSVKINEVSVVVPFKNEANRILPLLERIKSLSIPAHLKVEFIFVDDHSSDSSNQIVKANLNSVSKLIKSTERGKKQAIKLGVLSANYDFILTWDADTIPETNYFVEMEKLPEADMWILPVRLGGDRLIQKLGAIEFSWLQLLGIGFAKLLQPNLCNGANLFFRKSLFLTVDNKRSDYSLASGDDMFLLAAFRKVDADIQASSNQSLAVYAKSPETFEKLVLQRKRWAGKMNQLKTFFSIFYAFLLVVFVFLGFVLMAMTHLGWIILIPLLMKYFNEYILLQCEKRFNQWLSDLFVVLVHQIWYPLYLIRLIFPVKSREKRWAH